MKNNPAFIKWFVSLVQIGKRPEEVLRHQAIFLDYCLSNVYEYLDAPAREIANALLAVPGKHTQAVISYLTDIRGDNLSTAIQQLMITNMVTMEAVDGGDGTDMSYELGELSRVYLAKHHPLSSQQSEHFQARRAQILAMREKFIGSSETNRYLPHFIFIRIKDDVVVAKYLVDALSSVRVRDFNKAFELIERAEQLAPSYYEVHRVKGWAYTHSGNIAAAQDAYEAAVELEPTSAPLRFWYGGFLLRHTGNTVGASEQLRRAIALDPDALPIQNELGRCMMYMGMYRDADEIFGSVIVSETATTKELRIAYDSWCQVSSRQAQVLLDEGEYLRSFECFKDLFRKFNEIPEGIKDARIIDTILRSLPFMRRLGTHFARSPEGEEMAGWISLANSLSSPNGWSREFGTAPPADVSDILYGHIARFAASGTFGFIVSDDGAEHFFHRRNLVSGLQITMLKPGDRVSFRLGFNDKGTVADRVSLVIRG